MKHHLLIFLIFPLLLAGKESIELGNSAFKVQIATPDTMRDAMKTEFQRYDTCGAVIQVEINGKNMIVFPGLSDEFNIEHPTPPGYDNQNGKAGDPFLKIGIGILRREDSRNYFFYRAYPVIKYAETRFHRTENTVKFHQTQSDFNGWSYEYWKEYKVNPSERKIQISYTLKNTGKKELATNQYNHNYFYYGKEFPDLGYIIDSAFEPAPERVYDGFIQTGNRASNFQKNGYMFSLKKVPPEQHHVTLSHADSPLKIIISGDFTITRYAISFGKGSYISPEMYLHFSLAPGETKQWNRMYHFEYNTKK